MRGVGFVTVARLAPVGLSDLAALPLTATPQCRPLRLARLTDFADRADDRIVPMIEVHGRGVSQPAGTLRSGLNPGGKYGK
jgi:hypothetical protein